MKTLLPFALPSAAAVWPPAAVAWPVIAGEGEGRLSLKDVLDAGGTIGYLIIALSIVMVALIVQLLLLLRRGAMMPAGLAEEVHQNLAQGKVADAEAACRGRPSVLARMLSAGLTEVRIGYAAVEKAMEDAAVEQSARLLRRVEYLTTIGTVAPMLGLLGTVWGMILAFLEFEQKANPQVSELAPGIYRALVTTLFGLMVAVPAVSAYALFRNRVDERIAEAALLAEQVFADFKLLTAKRKRETGEAKPPASAAAAGGARRLAPEPAPIPPVAIQRERRP
ncbi:MAG TPA: MotA/TolQ/ExbB proton channel family protein [Planctomycetaceae bacterium]